MLKCHCFWHFPCKQSFRFKMGTIHGKRPNYRVFNPLLTQMGTAALYYFVSKKILHVMTTYELNDFI